MNLHNNPTTTSAEPLQSKMHSRYTCGSCGGRGGTFDDEGNYYKCMNCDGSGEVNS
jgi:DnaJ-class molecular chaperone